MGGDHAPSVAVEGAVAAAREARGALEVVLFGPKEEVARELARHETAGLALEVVDAPDVVGMDEAPSAALKAKPRSSIHLGLAAVAQGRADAFASAGNTGAVMAAALMGLGRVEGVARPALPGPFPTTEGRCVLLDVGANMDCRPEHLVQFARMGAVYAERVLGLDRPRVGLLNVGEEPSKGNEAAKAAHALLAAHADLYFVGNVEGRDLMRHVADVVVCDGFVGNVVLKYGESLRDVLPVLVRREVAALGADGSVAGEALGLLERILAGVARRFSYEEFGGTPLLGVAGAVVVGHGGSTARAIARMVAVAAETARQDVAGHLARALA